MTDWTDDGRALVAALTALAGQARVTSALLNDRLLHVRVVPAGPGSAAISVILSAGEMIFEAGRGARFELDGWATDRDELLELAGAVMTGGLTEDMSPGRVRFELHLRDGQIRTGGSTHGIPALLARPKRIHYQPYETPDSTRLNE